MEPVYDVGNVSGSKVIHRYIRETIPAPADQFVMVGRDDTPELVAYRLLSFLMVMKTERYEGADRTYMQVVPMCLDSEGIILFIDRDEDKTINHWCIRKDLSETESGICGYKVQWYPDYCQPFPSRPQPPPPNPYEITCNMGNTVR